MDGSDNTLTITNSNIAGNSTNGLNAEGGAIYADGVLNISNSSISGNVTQGERSFCGAIYAQANVAIINTTIAYNETQGDRGYGGAIFADGGVVNVLNSTIVGNKALGQINPSDVFNVGSAIYSDNTLNISNSIVIDNEAPQDGGPQLQEKNDSPDNGDGVVEFFGVNIIGADTATANGSTVINADRDDVFISGFTGFLRDNGGPAQTIALKIDATNPALDASSGLPTGADARGVDAFDFPGVGASEGTGLRDLGSFEVGELPSLIVTTTAGGNDSTDGETTLREAIIYANSIDGPSTITFAEGGQGLIRLTEGRLIDIVRELTIDGGGLVTITGDAGANDTTLEGGISDVAATMAADNLDDNTRIFDASADLTIDGLTLTGGYAAFHGAIFITGGNLTIRDSILAGNNGASAGGALGIGSNVDTATIIDSEFAGNVSGGRGGAIFSYLTNSALTITGSTISGNSTTGDGGKGGGVYTKGDVTITNSTISGNSTAGNDAAGGGVFAYGAVTIDSSTITGNSTAGEMFSDGGGVYGKAGIAVSNSIILGNEARFGNGQELYENPVVDDGLITFSGQNIVGANDFAFNIASNAEDGANAPVQNAAASDVFAATVYNNNGSQAGVLADNGGPVQTVALRDNAANPALDAAIGGTETDARGFAAVGGRDLGAYELNVDGEIIVTTTTDVVDAIDGVISLREAVAIANDKDGADTITFAAGGQGLIRLTIGEVEITDDLTIDGGGLVTITGDANGDDVATTGDIADVAASLAAYTLDDNSRIFVAPFEIGTNPDGSLFNASADLTIDGLTVTGGRADGDREYGGAIQAFGALTVEDSTFSGNSTDGYQSRGGAFVVSNGLTLTNSMISDNVTDGRQASGGGIFSNGGTIITNSVISDNTTTGIAADGGGLLVGGGGATITNSTFFGNTTRVNSRTAVDFFHSPI